MNGSRHLRTVVAAACAVALAACSQSASRPATAGALAPAPTPVTSGVVSEAAVTTRATVEKIDHETRQVTIRRPDGSRTSFRVDDRVKNLDQVQRGDVIVAEVYESLAYRLLEPGEGETGVAVAGAAGTAEQGQKPAVAGVAVTTVTAKVTAVDKKASTVTLQGPDGEPDEVKVRDPRRLEAVEVGDLVELTYTEALAISVVEPDAK
jgi:hypothetical protein